MSIHQDTHSFQDALETASIEAIETRLIDLGISLDEWEARGDLTDTARRGIALEMSELRAELEKRGAA